MLGEDPQRAGRDWRERIGIVLQSCRLDPYLTVRESLGLYAGYYRAPRPIEEVIELVGLGEQGRRPRQPALRRPAAPPRRRHGADRRPRAALPRRADHRLRPLGAAPGLGGDRRPARPRQDRLPHHPLHGRGAAPRRPGDDHRRAARSSPAAPRRTSATARASRRRSATARDGEEVALETTTPVADPQRADRLGARRRGVELEGLEVTRPSLEDIYLELTERAG